MHLECPARRSTVGLPLADLGEHLVEVLELVLVGLLVDVLPPLVIEVADGLFKDGLESFDELGTRNATLGSILQTCWSIPTKAS